MRNFSLFFCVVTTLMMVGCAAELPPSPTSVIQKPAISNTPPPPVVTQPTSAIKQHAIGTPEDARNHMLRGMAAIEMAKSTEDLGLAEDEFRMATEISPQMATAWFNLGKAQSQLGHYAEAIESYRKYLGLAPEAKDAQRVRDEIVKLEFRQELAAKTQARVGTWVGPDGTPYTLTLNGNRMILKTTRRHVREDEVLRTYSLAGSLSIGSPNQAEYQLMLQGHHLTGTWSRGAVYADKCTVPPDTSEASGELNDKDGKMVLHHDRTSFTAATQMSLLGDDSCASVVAGERKTTEETIYGPLDKGGLGVELYGFTGWWDGGFSPFLDSWQGRIGMRVQPNTPAYAAGLHDRDEILAIDGAAVKSLSPEETVVKLRGKPGSDLTLEIWRKDENKSFIVTLRRVELPSAPPQDAAAPWIN